MILDLVQQNNAGFMEYPGRTCVSFTRSEDWQLTVSGPSDQLSEPKTKLTAASADKKHQSKEYEVMMPLLEHKTQAVNKNYLKKLSAKNTIPSDSKAHAPNPYEASQPTKESNAVAIQPASNSDTPQVIGNDDRDTAQATGDDDWDNLQATDTVDANTGQSNNVSAGESTR